MSARLVCEFYVDGTPIPQGSKKGFSRPGSTFVQIVDDNAKVLKPWREHVTKVAAAAYSGPRVEGAVSMHLVFEFVKPKSVTREHPSVKPDLSKILRAVEDSITDAGNIWRDDAQVVIAYIEKQYAERAGVRVRIGELREGNKG